MLTRNSMTDATKGAGTAYTSRSPEFTCCFSIAEYFISGDGQIKHWPKEKELNET
jgi:hypothetical protein